QMPASAPAPLAELAAVACRKTQALGMALRAVWADGGAGGCDRRSAARVGPIAMAWQLAQPLRRVSELLYNYEGADLQGADLAPLISLDEIRWTERTRWPDGWADEIEGRSVEVEPGVWEIREGLGTPQLT